jgi:RNA polymerase sigma-70 factor (ECF subfamily)
MVTPMKPPPEPTPAAGPTGPLASGAFLTTRWTRVLAARGPSAEARDALRDLCTAYYAPVVAFLERSNTRDARDLAHGFFAALLEGDPLAHARRGQGRFRSYLLGALKHFVANQRAAERSAKRGGGLTHFPLGNHEAGEPEHSLPDHHELPPDAAFDRDWALAVIARALADLRRDAETSGRSEQFERLKPWLTGDADHGDQADCARHLGIELNTLKSEVHRLRLRFRQLVRDQVRSTLADPSCVADEMAALFAALRGG